MKTSCSVLALGLGLLLASRSQAEDSPFQASLSCQPAAGPGRILCELTTRATRGKLVWSDALVVRAPDFARPLRSRVVAQLGTPGAPGSGSAKLALVASSPGAGKLELLARGVICQHGSAAESCAPVLAPITVDLRVGPAQAKEP